MSEGTYVGPYGPLGCNIMILGECPTKYDIDAGKPFSKSYELDRCLKDAGIDKQSCWLSTVSKYHVPPNFKGKKIPFHIRARNAGIDMNKQLEELQTEINTLQPTMILGIGKAALWALTGHTEIGDYRGSILFGMGRKVICTYNPEGLSWNSPDTEFIGNWNRQVIMADLRRVKEESLTKELNLPTRHIRICQNSFELAEYCSRYENDIKLAADIEAGGHYLPICVGLAHNKYHSLVVPLWNVEGISNIPDIDLAQIYIHLARLLVDKSIIGQNFNYDRDKLLRLGFIISHLQSDTMLKAFALHPELPVSLAFLTSIYTREPYYKNEGMYEGKLEDLFLGCGRDACVTYEIDEIMESELDAVGQKKFYYNFLMQLPDFYWEIEKQGFKVDAEKQKVLIEKYITWSEKIKYELFKIAGTEVNLNSPKQVAHLLFETWKLPKRDGTGEEELTALLNIQSLDKIWKVHPEYRRGVELILEGRRVDRTISNSIMVLPDYDGRVKTAYFPCLKTGRSSTKQQEPPIRPTVEMIGLHGKKIHKALGTPFQTMTKHGDIGEDIRSQYIPDSEDEIFIQADSAQAEARVVFLLADDEWALEAIDKHDFHALTASWFFGGTEDDYSKRKLGYESPIRFVGKTLRHAGHLGAGKRRAAISVNTDARKFKINISITEANAERALKIFHSKQPKIQQVFQASVIKCLEKNRTLIAPVPYGFNSSVGGRRQFFEKWGEDLFREAFSYIPQRAVSDNTKGAGIRIRDRIPGIKIVMESHDSLLFCIAKDKVDEYVKIIKQEMERPIDFRTCCIQRRPLVIPCEIETGSNYQEMSKYKLVSSAPQKIEVKELSLVERFTAGG